MDMILIMLIALAIDLVLGDPPNTWHPVAWLGKLISLETRWALQRGKLTKLFLGTLIVLLTTGAVTTAAVFLLLYLQKLYWPLYLIIAGLLLKSTFSLRNLKKAMIEVKWFLAKDEIAHARTSLKALVSRDTANLNESQIVSATVESAAENACDSFVAPLFYFLLFGVPGAVAYRVINTFDSMIGYRGEWEHLGKFAARLDDMANFIPARISALIIVLAAWICKRDMSGSWQIMLRDHGRTQSPNAGWTMSAIAGALGVQLEKVGHYKLGDNHQALSVSMIDSSEKMIMVVAIIWSFLIILAGVVHFVIA